MYAIIQPKPLAGGIDAVASKSMAHRLLILAAICPSATDIDCGTTSADIDATIACLEALGAHITRTRRGFRVRPIAADSSNTADQGSRPLLDCGESGSTLRFLLPVVCALGRKACLTGHGRLAQRPLSPLYEQICSHGCHLSQKGSFPLCASGQLQSGYYVFPGNISSQFVSGLLLAAPLLSGRTKIFVEQPVQSAPYIRLTIDALATFGVRVRISEEIMRGSSYRCYAIDGKPHMSVPKAARVEGDWSNAAFWLAAGAIGGKPVTVRGLDLQSFQGDRMILAALARFGARIERRPHTVSVSGAQLWGQTFDVADFPDLVPPLAAVAAFAQGTTRLTHAGRLRLKESDRLVTVSEALSRLGVKAAITGDDDLVIEGSPALSGGIVDAANDHRIAMMAAIIAAYAQAATKICGAQCVAKSYPAFFDDFAALGGQVALHNREEV